MGVAARVAEAGPSCPVASLPPAALGSIREGRYSGPEGPPGPPPRARLSLAPRRVAWAAWAWRAERRREGFGLGFGLGLGKGRLEKAALPVGGHGAATVAPGACIAALAWLASSLLYLTPLAWPAEEPVPAHALPPRPHPPRVPTPPARPRLLTPGRRGSSAQTPNCAVLATASTACHTTPAPGFRALGVVETAATIKEVDRPA